MVKILLLLLCAIGIVGIYYLKRLCYIIYFVNDVNTNGLGESGKEKAYQDAKEEVDGLG